MSAVVVAAGSGVRLGAGTPKQFLLLGGRPVLAWALEAFQRCDAVDEIILVTKPEYVDFCRNELAPRHGLTKVSDVTPGGQERQDSVAAGLSRCSPETDVVLVHDGARPFARREDIERVIEGAAAHGCCTLGAPMKDTVKVCGPEGNILHTLERGSLWSVQTPQGFRRAVLAEALEAARESGFQATDDVQLVERLGHAAVAVPGSGFNIKITTPEDMVFAGAILRALEEGKHDENG